jgi:hypothetical protein
MQWLFEIWLSIPSNWPMVISAADMQPDVLAQRL